MLERTTDNAPTYAEVIDLMAGRGYCLAPQHLEDGYFWQIGGERLAHLYRLVWPIATDEQLAELASIGGVAMEMANHCLQQEALSKQEGGDHG